MAMKGVILSYDALLEVILLMVLGIGKSSIGGTT
jgi:hypothetical protein